MDMMDTANWKKEQLLAMKEEQACVQFCSNSLTGTPVQVLTGSHQATHLPLLARPRGPGFCKLQSDGWGQGLWVWRGLNPGGGHTWRKEWWTGELQSTTAVRKNVIDLMLILGEKEIQLHYILQNNHNFISKTDNFCQSWNFMGSKT